MNPYLKRPILLILIGIGFTKLSAQAPRIIYSEVFSTKADEAAHIFQLPNGNTFLFSNSGTDGFELRLWNDKHVLIRTETGAKAIGKMGIVGRSFQTSVINTGNDLLIFRHEMTSMGTAVLHKYVYSGSSGLLSKDTNLIIYDEAYRNKESGEKGLRKVAGTNIIKDKFSDAYAIADNNEFQSDPGQRLVLHHYDKLQKLMYSRNYSLPEASLDGVRFLDMIVEEDTAIIVLADCHKLSKGSNNNHTIYLSRITAQGIDHHKLTSIQKEDTKGMLTTDSAHTAFAVVLRSSNDYLSLYKEDQKLALLVDGATFETIFNKTLPALPVPDKYRIRTIGLRYKDLVEPRDIAYSPEGGLTVHTETVDVLQSVDNFYHLKGVGSVSFNRNGEVLQGPQNFKAQWTTGMPFFTLHQWKNGIELYTPGRKYDFEYNQFSTSYYHFNTARGGYIVYNSRPQLEVANPKEPLNVATIKTQDDVGVYLQRAGSTEPSINLFNVPEDGSANREILTGASSYHPTSATLALLVKEESRKDWVGKIAWVTFD